MEVAKDPGLGSKYKAPLKRIMNSDGSYNIKRVGGLSNMQDFYKFLTDVSLPLFMIYVVSFYIVINLFFSSLYLLVGVEQLNGINDQQSDFFTAFFFSVQTFTTVGYGSIAPNGMGVDIIAMFEAFVGLMSFAMATGVLYGRFSKPRTKIGFSKNIILTPFEGETAMMFKMVNMRKNVLLKTKVNVMLILDKGGDENQFNKLYFEIPLENNKVDFFPLTWTLVHKITEESPLYGLNISDMKAKNAELVILVETFDETYGQTILQKHSYAQEQWRENVKFATNFKINEQGKIELYVNEINQLLELN